MKDHSKNLEEIREIEQFLYQEASYLDQPDLESWISLFTEDGTYWMPAIPDQEDPINHVSLMYDDRVIMEIRKRNFVHPKAASKDYDVRCSHLISNVRILEQDEENRTLLVSSNFQCVIYYRNGQTLYAGTYQHELESHDHGFLIASKRVNLINCDAELGTIIIYI